jgi:hypothetical protein
MSSKGNGNWTTAVGDNDISDGQPSTVPRSGVARF